MKKGRHRRYEEARALKQQNDQLDDLFEEDEGPCLECDALPGQDCKGALQEQSQFSPSKLVPQ